MSELKKQLSWNRTRANLFHYRTASGQEVDVVLENAQAKLIGIEIKLGSTVTQKYFNGLKALSDDLPHQFIRGLVIYTGDTVLSFGKNLYAVPVSCLWNSP